MDATDLSEFCPRCQQVEGTFEFIEEGRSVRRCVACGVPVDAGLSLETPPPGIPSPPDVKILLADDDGIIRQMLGDALRFKGYTVLEAEDGPATLAAVERERPHLVLLDIVMPGLDGFEVCRRLKADPATRPIPVVLITAMDDRTLQRRAFDAGAEMALQKPAEITGILRTVEAALSLAALRAAPLPVYMGEGSAIPTDLTVPMQDAQLDVWTVDGATFQATLSLHLHAEGHSGPQTVQDRLNDPDLFVALALPGEVAPVLLNKIQVVRVDVKEAWTADAAEASADLPVEAVRVQLINGVQLSGTVRIDAPSERRRLLDFLNTQPAFLPLQGADRLHLLQKRYIARVVPAAHSA